jgi:hypothetical protein
VGVDREKHLQNATKKAMTASREALYNETVSVVTDLARAEGDLDKLEDRFRALYEKELLLVESDAVEELMVKARMILDACTRPLQSCEDRKSSRTSPIAWPGRRGRRSRTTPSCIRRKNRSKGSVRTACPGGRYRRSWRRPRAADRASIPSAPLRRG